VGVSEECLRRELLEEMGIEIEPYAYFAENEHAYETVTIRLIAYRANFVSGEIVLVDHDAYRWASKTELGEFEFAPADVGFVREMGSINN
jgi:8-oxo-dGTP diphosphatase